LLPPAQVALEIDASAIPVMQGVRELVQAGVKSTATVPNSHFAALSDVARVPSEQLPVLLDPQTSGAIQRAVSVL
jgi:selenophosphate synthase